MFCDMTFANFDDTLHHIQLNHQGMPSLLLENATLARETKKRLGDYIDFNSKGFSVECSSCFEIFSNVEKLTEHGKKTHNSELRPEVIQKMQKIIGTVNDDDSPICEHCCQKFIGVIFTEINKKIMNVCFNCYANYFGENALARLTVGTTDEMIQKLRTPL